VARTPKDHKTLARIRAAAEKPVRILPYSAGKAGVIDKPPAGIGAILKEPNLLRLKASQEIGTPRLMKERVHTNSRY
jgi:hypothetical protein